MGEFTYNQAILNLAGRMIDAMDDGKEQGKTGWDDPELFTDIDAYKSLYEAIREDRYVDAANFCMMLDLRKNLE